MGRAGILFLGLFFVAAVYADDYTTSVGKTESVGTTEAVGKTDSVGTLDPLGNGKQNNQKTPNSTTPAAGAPKKPPGVPTIDITGNPNFIDVKPSGTSKKDSTTDSSGTTTGHFQIPGGHQDTSGGGGEEFDPGAFYGQGLDAGANFPAGAFDGSAIEGMAELGSVVVEASKTNVNEKSSEQNAPQGYMMMRGPDDGSMGDPSEMNPAMVPGGSAGC